MRLADFIRHDMEAILADWEKFARTLLPAAANLRSSALRDHAQQILEAVANDLWTSQSAEAELAKSTGQMPTLAGAPETAAQTHAILRARGGFDITQLVAEYRALRASVLRLWLAACQPGAPDQGDIIRFNEAIDQAVAESVGYFSAQVDQARNLLIGMLGHDMRSPLQTIQATASYLVALNAGEKVSAAAARLIRGGERMQGLLDDMLDFNRTRLGLGINIAPAAVDLADLLADEIGQLQAAHPDRHIEWRACGDCAGVWDGRRLQQLLGNLVLNALRYGAPDEPVCVTLNGEPAEVCLAVKNSGPAIEIDALERIFDPLHRGMHQGDPNTEGSLGLGLYIVREIAKAHGGEIGACSDANGTVFALRLPRRC
ncbi:sensor histidine kinase [Paraburkholderia sp. BCC1886]|uniref:sensor histidine kinase n=1 Tax=Paraburkholderia sp. BCC1886 TaxID=2562670 RepID=UPI0011835F1D|nr:sensor histidine kinase [Paraburkholderia sp. BCC1886]